MHIIYIKQKLYFDMIKSSAIPVQIWFIDNGGESTF